MRRTDIDDDGAKILAGTSAPSSGPPLGPTVIKFPRSSAAALAAEGSEGAGVSSASASSFVLLSVPVHAVLMRLQGRFPRVQVLAGAPREEERARRPSAALEGEEDAS